MQEHNSSSVQEYGSLLTETSVCMDGASRLLRLVELAQELGAEPVAEEARELAARVRGVPTTVWRVPKNPRDAWAENPSDQSCRFLHDLEIGTELVVSKELLVVAQFVATLTQRTLGWLLLTEGLSYSAREGNRRRKVRLGTNQIGWISTGSFDGTWYLDKLRSIAKDCDSRIESSYWK
jgi:hypothetical protein